METVLTENTKRALKCGQTFFKSYDLDVLLASVLAFCWRYSKSVELLHFSDAFALQYGT